MSRKQDDELKDAELIILQIEKEIASLVRQLSAAPPDAVALDLMLFSASSNFTSTE